MLSVREEKEEALGYDPWLAGHLAVTVTGAGETLSYNSLLS